MKVIDPHRFGGGGVQPRYIEMLGTTGVGNHVFHSVDDGATVLDLNFEDDAMPASYTTKDDGRTFHWKGKSPTQGASGSQSWGYIWGVGDGRNSTQSPYISTSWLSRNTDPTGSGLTVKNWGIGVQIKPVGSVPISYLLFQNTAAVDFDVRVDEWFDFFLIGQRNNYTMIVIGEDGVAHTLNQYIWSGSTSYAGYWFGDLGFAANNSPPRKFSIGASYRRGADIIFTVVNPYARFSHWHYKLDATDCAEVAGTFPELPDLRTLTFYTAGRLRNWWEMDEALGDTTTNIVDKTGNSPINDGVNVAANTVYYDYP